MRTKERRSALKKKKKAALKKKKERLQKGEEGERKGGRKEVNESWPPAQGKGLDNEEGFCGGGKSPDKRVVQLLDMTAHAEKNLADRRGKTGKVNEHLKRDRAQHGYNNQAPPDLVLRRS